MAKIPDLSAPSLHRYIIENVEKGTEVRTDRWAGYNGVAERGYKQVETNVSKSGDPAHIKMPHILVMDNTGSAVVIFVGLTPTKKVKYFLQKNQTISKKFNLFIFKRILCYKESIKFKIIPI